MNWATELAAFDPSPELVEWVRERVAKLADESAQALRWRDLKIDKLTLELAHPRPMRFGASSEAFAAAHRDLFDETLAVDIAACEAEREAAAMGPHRPAPARPPRERAGRQPLPAHLERVEHRHEPALRTRTACGTEMVKIGEDVSEKLSVVPARFFVERHVYPKYVCRPCETIVTAPAPAALIDGGLAAPALLAWVMVGKYVDHLPLYRLEQQAAREGVILSRSTLAEWVGRIGVALEPLGARLSERLLQDAVLHADETPVAQLDPGRGQTKRAYLWAYRNNALGPAPPIVVLDYQGGRGGEHARQFLQGWSGALMVDDYAGYKTLFRAGVTELACLAHARRKFFELHQANQSPVAAEALQRIAELYAIEAECRHASVEERARRREHASQARLDALHRWLLHTRNSVADGSALARAIDYSLKRWEALARYARNGLFPIDNNPVENAIRPIALGKKNWLFAGSEAAGRRAAVIQSLLGTARLNGLDPLAWLTDTLEKLPSWPNRRIDELLPITIASSDSGA